MSQHDGEVLHDVVSKGRARWVPLLDVQFWEVIELLVDCVGVDRLLIVFDDLQIVLGELLHFVHIDVRRLLLFLVHHFIFLRFKGCLLKYFKNF